MKIAVKTLRKGATESEKAEFLKEAKLMWNFKHEHILNLNAICLDNDPHFLILELMEGSDLLSYLRQNRPKGLIHSISLLDLVQMCLDVSKGKYIQILI
jgi:proto-oncogene tyrosine-protein kinase ROS